MRHNHDDTSCMPKCHGNLLQIPYAGDTIVLNRDVKVKILARGGSAMPSEN